MATEGQPVNEEEPHPMSEKLMTIRKMCEAFGVTPRTLRFYEARALIFPERRGQHRCMIAGIARG